MAKTLLGCNTFGLRKELTEDFEGTLKQIKEIGFDCVEPMLFNYKKQGKNVPKNYWCNDFIDYAVPFVKDLGLKFSSCHFGLDVMGMPLSEKALVKYILNVHEKSGITRFVSSGLFDNEKSALKCASLMGEVAEKVASEGIEILFHNHEDELLPTKSGDKTLLELYFENTSDKVALELDVGWAAIYNDEIEIVKKFADRLEILHCKDFFKESMPLTRKTAKHSDFAPIGDGFVRHKEAIDLLGTCKNFSGIIVLDQDHSGGSMLEDLEKGYKNVKNMLE